MPPYGQIVIGPPGSGKSTYCSGMNQFLNAIGRHSAIINMDPANDRLPYDCAIDIRDFITLEEIMNDENLQLGPNGGLIYALESFEKSIEYFIEEIQGLIELQSKNGDTCYLLFDCPGQIELFTNNPIFHKIYNRLIKELDFRMCVISLVDSFSITIPSNYISSLLLVLRSMLQMDLPQVNIFSKIDLLKNIVDSNKASKRANIERRNQTGEDMDEDDKEGADDGGLPFDLKYYTEVEDLQRILPFVETEEDNPRGRFFKEKYFKLTSLLADLVEDFGLVEFQVLSIEDKNSMINILSLIDKSNGYTFGSNELGGDSIWQDAVRQSSLGFMEDIDIQERWLDKKEEWDELEAEKRKELQEYFDEGKESKEPMDEDEEWESALKEWETNNNRTFNK